MYLRSKLPKVTVQSNHLCWICDNFNTAKSYEYLQWPDLPHIREIKLKQFKVNLLVRILSGKQGWSRIAIAY